MRKQIELDRFRQEIDRVWSLSLNEMEVLDNFLSLILVGDKKLKQIEQLLNDETDSLLHTLNQYDTTDFAKDLCGLVDEGNCKKLEDFDIDDMINYIKNEGFEIIKTENNLDIVTETNLEEMKELFLNLSPQKQSEIINNLKK